MDKKERETKVAEYTVEEFLKRLADQVPDRGAHGVRCFGLLGPRAKALRYAGFLRLLGKPLPPRPPRLRWAASIMVTWGYDSLRDKFGARMIWRHRLPPMLPGAT